MQTVIGACLPACLWISLCMVCAWVMGGACRRCLGCFGRLGARGLQHRRAPRQSRGAARPLERWPTFGGYGWHGPDPSDDPAPHLGGSGRTPSCPSQAPGTLLVSLGLNGNSAGTPPPRMQACSPHACFATCLLDAFVFARHQAPEARLDGHALPVQLELLLLNLRQQAPAAEEVQGGAAAGDRAWMLVCVHARACAHFDRPRRRVCEPAW